MLPNDSRLEYLQIILENLFSINTHEEIQNLVSFSIKLFSTINLKEQKLAIPFLKNNMKSHIWNPYLTKIYETVLISFQIKNLYFLIKYLIDESCAFLKLKCGYDIVNKLISILPISKYYLDLCIKLFASAESFYRKHEIGTLVEIVKKINYLSIDECVELDTIKTSLDTDYVNNQKYHFLCSKAIMNSMKSKMLKFLINKNLHRVALQMAEQKNILFHRAFLSEFIYPNIDITEYFNDNCCDIESMTTKNIRTINRSNLLDDNNNSDKNIVYNVNNSVNKGINKFKHGSIPKLNKDSKLVKLLNNSRGLTIIKTILDNFDTLSNKPILDILIKLQYFRQLDCLSGVSEVLLSLNQEKYGELLKGCKVISLENNIRSNQIPYHNENTDEKDDYKRYSPINLYLNNNSIITKGIIDDKNDFNNMFMKNIDSYYQNDNSLKQIPMNNNYTINSVNPVNNISYLTPGSGSENYSNQKVFYNGFDNNINFSHSYFSPNIEYKQHQRDGVIFSNNFTDNTNNKIYFNQKQHNQPYYGNAQLQNSNINLRKNFYPTQNQNVNSIINTNNFNNGEYYGSSHLYNKLYGINNNYYPQLYKN